MRTPIIVAILAALAVLGGAAWLLTPKTHDIERRSSASEMVESSATPIAGAPSGGGFRSECPAMTNPGGGLKRLDDFDPKPSPVDASVSLPSLGANGPIVTVGFDEHKQMNVPTNARDIAWLYQGPFPGDTQNTVLAGHISYHRQAGTFFRLRELEPGDDVKVRFEKRSFEFRVVWSCLFDRNTPLADQIMGRTTVTSVTLISCGGVFDPVAHTHTKRVAVRAELLNA